MTINKMADRILTLIPDMFFAAKVEETAKHLGISLVTLLSEESLIEEVRRESPSIVIIDLNFDAARSPEVIKNVKLACSPNPVRVLAFLSHVQADLADSARRAGAYVVVPRSYFSKHLPEILQGNF
jgi:DNA-binding NarL/FixJ family response regulator